MNDRYVIATLSELLAVTREGERGCSVCAEHARDESLKRLFLARASRRAATAAELRDLIGRIGGGDHTAQGTIRGAHQRGWANLRSALSLNDDEALVDECERGEDHALEVYRNALDDHLPELVREVVLTQFEGMMDDHDQIRILRNEPPRGIVVASGGGNARQ
jgi:uncharacterized protein (TIGR02284 family)